MRSLAHTLACVSTVWLLAMLPIHAQSFNLSLPDTTVLLNDTVSVPIYTTGFDSMASMQFSLRWDVSVMEYRNFRIADLENVAVGAIAADQGVLRVSWFDDSGLGIKSLADGDIVLRLNFEAVGEVGDVTPVTFSSDPLQVQVSQNQGGQYVLIDPELVDGQVEIASLVNVAAQVNDVICFGDSTGNIAVDIHSGVDNISIEWQGPDGFSSEQMLLNNLPVGEYTLTVRDENGVAIFTSTYTVSGPVAPLALTVSDVQPSNCDAPTGRVTAVASGGTAGYTFSLVGQSNSTGIFEQLTAGSYALVVVDDQGCSVRDSVTVQEPLRPVLELPTERALCDPTLTINAGGAADYQYSWSTGEATRTIVVTTPGSYIVTATNAANCITVDTVIVIDGQQIDLSLETPFLDICRGDSLLLEVSGAEQYIWLDTSASLDRTTGGRVLAMPENTTTYQVVGSTPCSRDTMEVEVLVYPVTATAGPDTCTAPGQTVQLQASGGIRYNWISTGAPLSNDEVPNPMTSPNKDAVFVVRIEDQFGCITIDSAEVMVVRDVSSIRPINMITPNGDGINDVLEFNSLGKFNVNTLKVYNRWGGLVYNKINYQQDDERFDGTVDGKLLPAGTYYYVLSFVVGDVKQALTIVRE